MTQLVLTGAVILAALLLFGTEIVRAATKKISVPFEYLFLELSVSFSVPARLMKAIIRRESNFNPLAVNQEPAADKRLGRNVDSIGLGQILWPDTAKALDPSVTREGLFDPRTNLSLSYQLMKELLIRFPHHDTDGFPDRAVSAYNAGSVHYTASGSFVNQSYVDDVKRFWRIYA